MHISHTIEQMEAAHASGDKIAAVQILRRHYIALQTPYTLGHLAHLARLYWLCPGDTIPMLPTRKPSPNP